MPITSCAHQTSPRWRPPFLSDLHRRRSPLPTPPPGRSTRPTLRRTPSSPVHRGRRATTSARQVSVLDSPPSREGALGRRRSHGPSPPSFRKEIALGPLDGGRCVVVRREVLITVVRTIAPRSGFIRARSPTNPFRSSTSFDHRAPSSAHLLDLRGRRMKRRLNWYCGGQSIDICEE